MRLLKKSWVLPESMPKKIGEKDINTHVVAVFAFVEKSGKILLARRSKKDPQTPGVWFIPGGKVEMNLGHNVLLETLKREIKEEVGIEIKDNIIFLSDDGFIRVSGHHVIGLVFLCRWRGGEVKPLEDQEEVRWFTKEELKDFSELPEYFKPHVAKLLQILK